MPVRPTAPAVAVHAPTIPVTPLDRPHRGCPWQAARVRTA